MYYLLLYESTLDSAKVMNLPLDTKGFWMLSLLAASRNHRERGTLPDFDDLAFITRVPLDQVQGYLDQLVQAHLIVLRHDGKYTVYHWDTYQPKTSRERTQRWRERHSDAVTRSDVTERHETSRDAGDDRVTASDGCVTLQTRRDETREETPPLAPLEGGRKTSSRAPRKSKKPPPRMPTPAELEARTHDQEANHEPKRRSR